MILLYARIGTNWWWINMGCGIMMKVIYLMCDDVWCWYFYCVIMLNFSVIYSVDRIFVSCSVNGIFVSHSTNGISCIICKFWWCAIYVEYWFLFVNTNTNYRSVLGYCSNKLTNYYNGRKLVLIYTFIIIYVWI